MEHYILSLLIFVPVFGALIMLPVSKFLGSTTPRIVALASTGIQLLLSIWLYCNFDSSVSIQNSPFTPYKYYQLVLLSIII